MRNSLETGCTMTPQRFREIRLTFERIIALSPPERARASGELRQADIGLAEEVEALLAAYDRRAGFIEVPVASLHEQDAASAVHSSEGASIGPYRLLELVGQGGMGQVWRAEQLLPVRRIVALKLIKAGMDTREVVARFESERQAVALMEHPAIAKVFDAGSTSEGRPYFAMEYVDGVPITTYCDQNRLRLRERLKLFTRVCEGIQHAHQKAIIHRDVKPSNILVVELDGKPVPKIIDFGVARALAPDDGDETAFTRAGAILGTLDYMSPEQASTVSADIDTRTDVYSLGVVLFELLVGALPFNLRGLPFAEVLRIVGEADAPRPSTVAGGQNADSAAYERSSTHSELVSELRGDLDSIALKALEKDRSRRYGSPAELAADVNRYLRNEPVTARSGSARYLLWKYVRRHRTAMVAAVILLALAVSFGISQAVQLRRITREKDRADRVAKFMTEMFRVSDPGQSRGNKVTAREILDKASADIGKGLADDPELQAQMMDVMGTVYFSLGLYPPAESLLSRTLEIRRRTLGSENSATANSMNMLANVFFREGRRAEAEKIYRETIGIRRRVLGPDHPETLSSMNNLAEVLSVTGRFSEAEQMHREILAIRRNRLGPEHPDTLNSMDNLGNVLDRQGRYAEAETLGRQTLDAMRKVLGPEHRTTLRAAHRLANTYYDEGRIDETEKLDRQVLEARLHILGPLHQETLTAMIALGDTLDAQHRYAEAAALDRKALDTQRQVLGPEHPDTLLAMNNLARILTGQGKYAEAETLYREVVETRERSLGPENTDTLSSSGNLAFLLMRRGAFQEAERIARNTRDAQLRVAGVDNPRAAATTFTLACIAANKGRATEALALLREAVDHGLPPKQALAINSEPGLQPLHRHPDFSTLVTYARQRAGVFQSH